jgi:T-complex protein 1 subunit theta
VLQVVHPAAKLVAMAAKAQEDEIGDATNLVVVFAGVLLEYAEVLLRQVLVRREFYLFRKSNLLTPI